MTVNHSGSTPELAEPRRSAGVAAGDESARPTLLRIPFDRVTMTEAIQTIVGSLAGDRTRQVCFVNADCVNQSYRSLDYLAVLRSADHVFADGIGVSIAGRALGMPIPENVNGTDLFPRLCEELSGTGTRLYLLGARPGRADRVADWINEHCSGIEITGCRDGYFTADEEPRVLSEIRESRSDLLLVALGTPRQDLWIHKHLACLGVQVAMGVGGLFDFYSGSVPRAPNWMRKRGLEWLYRLKQEPRRLGRRYLLGNPQFLARVAFARFDSAELRQSRRPNSASADVPKESEA